MDSQPQWQDRLSGFLKGNTTQLADADTTLSFKARATDDKAAIEDVVKTTERVKGEVLVKLGEGGEYC